MVFVHNVLNPTNQIAADIAVRVLGEIGKISKTTVLDFRLVIPVIDLAISVVVSGLVKRINGAVVSSDWTNVVCYDINHHPDVASVACRNEIN